MTTSEQLEREAERTRSQITDTLAELRERMTPGQMLDEALDYARDGSVGEFARNLGRQVVNNPLPVALITAGIGWLALGGGRNGAGPTSRAIADEASGWAHDVGRWAHQAAYRAEDWKQRAGESTEEWNARTRAMAADAAERARRAAEAWQRRVGATGSEIGETVDSWVSEAQHTAEDWTQRAGETAEQWAARTEAMASDAAKRAHKAAAEWRRRAGAAGAAMGQTAADAYDRTAESARHAVDAIGRSASSVGAGAANTGRNVANYLKDEPLVLAGIGLALGAVLGAAIPESETENRWIGDQSDAFKARAKDAARDQWEKGKQVAETAWEEGKHEAERQGFVPESGKADEQGGQASQTVQPGAAR